MPHKQDITHDLRWIIKAIECWLGDNSKHQAECVAGGLLIDHRGDHEPGMTVVVVHKVVQKSGPPHTPAGLFSIWTYGFPIPTLYPPIAPVARIFRPTIRPDLA